MKRAIIIGLRKLLEASSEHGFPTRFNNWMEVDIFYTDINVILYYIIHYIHVIFVIVFRYIHKSKILVSRIVLQSDNFLLFFKQPCFQILDFSL